MLLYLGAFAPGPDAVAALIALQIMVCVIFIFFGLTGLGEKLVDRIPNSLKSGIIIGAGIAALMGELREGGRIQNTPISLIAGSLIAFYIMFSRSFKDVMARHPLAKKIGDFGMVPAILVAMFKGEARNNLARAVFFNRLGQMHDRTHNDQQHSAAGCNLVVAAIVLWNTVYLAAAVETLRRTGVDVPDDLLRHVWPLGWDHVSLTGDYRWSIDNPKSIDRLRPLRLERLSALTPA